jgi:hypothetical protein
MTPREKALEEALKVIFEKARAALSLPASAGEEASDRREAAKKLLCDVCACAAECGDTLDLPHVLKDCVGPLETLIAERDATLQLLELSRRFMDPSGPFDVPALLSELARAKSRLAELEARPAPAELRERVARLVREKLQAKTSVDSVMRRHVWIEGQDELADAILAIPELAGGSEWRPIETAPKDRPIQVWHNPEADPGPDVKDDGSYTLSLFKAHAEGLRSGPAGIYNAVWGGAFNLSTWEYPNQGSLPDWWFERDSEFEFPLNPTHWREMPAPPASGSAS